MKAIELENFLIKHFPNITRNQMQLAITIVNNTFILRKRISESSSEAKLKAIASQLKSLLLTVLEE